MLIDESADLSAVFGRVQKLIGEFHITRVIDCLGKYPQLTLEQISPGRIVLSRICRVRHQAVYIHPFAILYLLLKYALCLRTQRERLTCGDIHGLMMFDGQIVAGNIDDQHTD